MLPIQETFEFGQARLRTKNSLEFTQRASGDSVWYMVEDEASGKFFRIGIPEYTFLSLLDGKRTVNSALMRVSSLLKQSAMDDREAANICRWAIESGLVETELSSSSSRREEKDRREFFARTMSWINPVTLKIPLFRPDPLVERITASMGWLVSPGGILLWFMVVAFGFYQLLMNFDRFFAGQVNSISVLDAWYFAVAWIVLKLIHELAHSIVCKKYGGSVRSSGILLLLLIPLPYVDVSSSWRFESKWRRIITAAAGILAELFIAAIACCIWVWSSPGPIQYHAGNVIITATISTIFFNINPLMRFDGYYILSDWLDIPNLATHGRQYIKSFFKRIYFGTRIQPVKSGGWRGIVVKGYGFLAMAWFLTIAVGLSIGASNFIEGFGLMVVFISLSLWFVVPVVKLFRYVTLGTEFESPNRIWFATASTLTVVILAGVLLLVPAPTVITAPVVVDFKPHKIIRSASSGFARMIHVDNGQVVNQGELLLSLENPELEAEYNSLLIDIRISELKINSMVNAEEVALLQLEREHLAAAEIRKEELELLLDKLEVRALSDGVVLALDLPSKLDTYLKPGDELLSLGDPENLHVIAMTAQEDVDWLKHRDDPNVQLLIWGRHKDTIIDGQIATIEPRARDDLPHEAFAAANGGTLAVVPRQQVESGGEMPTEDDEWMLTHPRVSVHVDLKDSDKLELMAGQSGVMLIRSRHENLGHYLGDQLIRFVRHNNLRTHGL